MAAEDRPVRSRLSDFLGSLRTQIRAALAVGLPADDVRRSEDEDASQESDGGQAPGRSAAGTTVRRYTETPPAT